MKIEYIETLPVKTETNTYRNTKEQYLPPDQNGREINIHLLKNCLVSGRNLHYPNVLLYSCNDSRLYLPYKERTMSLKMGSIYESNGMEFDLSIIGNNIDDNTNLEICLNDNLFFFIYNTDNYYHFIYDSLPILNTFFHLKKQYPDMKLLMNYPNQDKREKQKFYKFILESLEILGLEKEYIIVDDKTIYKNVYISTSYTHDFDSNLPPRSEIFQLYKLMLDNVLAASTSTIPPTETQKLIATPSKIYISRRTWLHNDTSNIGTNYTTRRHLTNEDELVDLLVSRGYREVFTENMSMKEKILLFYNAESVVGSIGGGIANVVFSKPECKLIALVSPEFLKINWRFRYCLDTVRTIYFEDCYNTENGKFKKYMRVKNKDSTMIGEIEEVGEDILKIKITDGSNTGWNADGKYCLVEMKKEDVETLDNGLNSPWYANLQNIVLS